MEEEKSITTEKETNGDIKALQSEKVIVVKTDTMRYDRGHKYLLTGSHSFKIKCVIAVNSNDLPGLKHLKQSQTG